MRKMIEEERRKKEKSRYRLGFSRGARGKENPKDCKPLTSSEEMGGIPHEKREKNAQGDDLPFWIRY